MSAVYVSIVPTALKTSGTEFEQRGFWDSGGIWTETFVSGTAEDTDV